VTAKIYKKSRKKLSTNYFMTKKETKEDYKKKTISEVEFESKFKKAKKHIKDTRFKGERGKLHNNIC